MYTCTISFSTFSFLYFFERRFLTIFATRTRATNAEGRGGGGGIAREGRISATSRKHEINFNCARQGGRLTCARVNGVYL